MSSNVYSVLGLLHHVDAGDTADVSEVNATSIFTVEVCRLVSVCVYISLCFEQKRGEREER
jgi:hypothetical protein